MGTDKCLISRSEQCTKQVPSAAQDRMNQMLCAVQLVWELASCGLHRQMGGFHALAQYSTPHSAAITPTPKQPQARP